MEIAVIDYGMSNLRSVVNALRHVADGAEITVSSDPAAIARADKVVFPGQGAMRDCVAELDARSLRAAVLQAADEKPFLGICVGAQLLLERSEEGGNVAALGVFPGEVRRFADGMRDTNGLRLKVPHMGWNGVRQTQPHPLWYGIADQARFYFVHSYYLQPAVASLSVGESEYPFNFTVALARANIFATQFHPEKSQHAGLQLLRNFVHWNGQGA